MVPLQGSFLQIAEDRKNVDAVERMRSLRRTVVERGFLRQFDQVATCDLPLLLCVMNSSRLRPATQGLCSRSSAIVDTVRPWPS